MVTGQLGPCTGNIVAIPRLNFPGICLMDGPLAIRIANYASVFPAGVTAAASWDKDILYERGYAMGQEFKGKGAHIYLGPVAGPLGRSAYSGRNWEGFAADPYLTGLAMEHTINGVQDAGVQAVAKHFIGNEQETMRNPTWNESGPVGSVIQESVSSNIDDRTMHELYLWPFANAVRAQVSSVMCAYNRINGSYACENSKTQNGLLKTELGFQGHVVADWGGTHSGLASIDGGLDLNMPGGLGSFGKINTNDMSFFGGNVTMAINNGTLEETRLDDMIVRIMTPYYWLGQDKDYPTVDPSAGDLNTFVPRSQWLREFNLTGTRNRDVRGDHGEFIRRSAAESTVLLKNKNHALPLKSPKSIAVFGNDAGQPTNGPYNEVTFEYGTFAVGGGSGTGRFSYIVSPLEAIKARAKEDKTSLVNSWLNNTLVATTDISHEMFYVPEPPSACLVFVKTWAEEGTDREQLELDYNGTEVVESVAAACNNTIVVTHSAGINVLPFANHPNVTAILAAHFPGQESGNSIVDVLYGDVHPSGRLPYTIARNSSDYNAPITTDIMTNGTYDWQSWFDEKLEIDYRYFDAHNIPVQYEFGFGLSYSNFNISNIATTKLMDSITSVPEDAPTRPGGNPELWEPIYNVTVSVANTGDVEDATVPQLYVTFPDSAPAGTPPKQLRGFEKVSLEPGKSTKVNFELMRRDLSYWDIISQQWLIPEGEFVVRVGLSSRNLKQMARITPVSEQ